VHIDIYMYEMLIVGARSNSPELVMLRFFAYVDGRLPSRTVCHMESCLYPYCSAYVGAREQRVLSALRWLLFLRICMTVCVCRPRPAQVALLSCWFHPYEEVSVVVAWGMAMNINL
jgi:hypothetical protein